MLNQEDGGKNTHIEHSQTTVPIITPNLTREPSLENGLPYTRAEVENVESIHRLMQENKSKDLPIEVFEMTSGRIHVLK
jgi:hypothetical protein